MKKPKDKDRLAAYILITAIIIFLASSAYTFYSLKYKNDEFMKNMAKSKDINQIYQFYIASNPDIKERQYFGDEKASITIIAYLDPRSESSRRFIKETFPLIQEEFIDTGKAKLYPKNYITQKDIEEKTERFIYAQSQICIIKLKPDKFYDIYIKLSETNNINEIAEIIKQHNITAKEFNDCLKDISHKELQQDTAETENYGIPGDPRIYIGILGKDNKIFDGIPAYTRIRRTLIDHQTTLGMENR